MSIMNAIRKRFTKEGAERYRKAELVIVRLNLDVDDIFYVIVKDRFNLALDDELLTRVELDRLLELYSKNYGDISIMFV